MRRKAALILTTLSALVLALIFWYASGVPVVKDIPRAESYQSAAIPAVPADTIATTTAATSSQPTAPISEPKKNAINLAVPFAAQAPFGDWSMPYKEACEEASLIMVDYYLRGATLSKQQMKDDIDGQVAWQQSFWGGHYDIGVERTKELAKQFYPDFTHLVIYDLTAEKIREQLRLGRPVIVPAAGRELFNPNFTAPGPLYHMLVIKGFTADGRFITNDPGTRNGADYVYDSDILMSAIRDWSGSAPEGAKVGLVMYQ